MNTRELCVYDLGTNQRVTLRERPLKRSDLKDFVACYGDKRKRHGRRETERFRRFDYEELAKRNKLNLDIFWLKEASATDPDSLPPPADLAAEIVGSQQTAQRKFRSGAVKLSSHPTY